MSHRPARIRILLALAGCLFAATSALADAPVIPAGTDYGAGLKGQEVATVDAVVATPEAFAGRSVVVTGRISDVCEKKGCWTVLRGETASVRVMHGDHEFAVPADCRGKTAYAEGRVTVAATNRHEIEHYASESRGEVPEALDAERTVKFTATGLRLVDR